MSFSCNKDCQNGGYCTLADRVNGENDEDGLVIVQNDDGDYIHFVEQCVCMPGYEGTNCEIFIPECTVPTGDGTFICNNGSPCSDDINSRSQCDCSEARELSRFAEYMCRRPATERCGNGISAAKAFCTNGGSCLTNVGYARNASNPFQHVGCLCPPEFEGPHCEMLLGTKDKYDLSPSNNDGSSKSFDEESSVANEDGSLNLASGGSSNTINEVNANVSESTNGNTTEKTLMLISSCFLFILGLVIVALFVYKIRHAKKGEQSRKSTNEEGLMRDWAHEDGERSPEGRATSELEVEYLCEEDGDVGSNPKAEKSSSQARGLRSFLSSTFSLLSPIEENDTALQEEDSMRGANIENKRGPGGYRIAFDEDHDEAYDEERYVGEYGRAKNGYASRTKTYA